MDSQSMSCRRLDERIAEELVVRLGSKVGLAVVAALNDVLGLARDEVTGKTSHDRTVVPANRKRRFCCQ